MGYQETLIYTSKSNVKMNCENIERILKMFKKYNICCDDDTVVRCVSRLHFNKPVGEFKEGMEMLVICGERSAQRNPDRLFEGISNLTVEEKEIISKIHIDYIENRRDILEAEKSAIMVEQLNLQPEK